MDGELEALLENGEGLSDKNQVLSLSRLMVRIETLEQKLTCLKLIQVRRTQLKGRNPRPVTGMSLELLLEQEGEGGGEGLALVPPSQARAGRFCLGCRSHGISTLCSFRFLGNSL